MTTNDSSGLAVVGEAAVASGHPASRPAGVSPTYRSGLTAVEALSDVYPEAGRTSLNSCRAQRGIEYKNVALPRSIDE